MQYALFHFKLCCTYTAVSVCIAKLIKLTIKNAPAYVYRFRVAFAASNSGSRSWNLLPRLDSEYPGPDSESYDCRDLSLESNGWWWEPLCSISNDGRRSEGMSVLEARSKEDDSSPDSRSPCDVSLWLCPYVLGWGRSLKGVPCLEFSLLKCTRSLLEPCSELFGECWSGGCSAAGRDVVAAVLPEAEETGVRGMPEVWCEEGLGMHAVYCRLIRDMR